MHRVRTIHQMKLDEAIVFGNLQRVSGYAERSMVNQ